MTKSTVTVTDKTELHVHLWTKDSQELIVDADAVCTDIYDDHLQFGLELPNGQWLEIRVPIK